MAEHPRSVVFDRAAAYYDRTRDVSADTRRAATEVLVGELRGRGSILEVGVGTGLVALPLRRSGLQVVGIDLSAPMLGKLLEKAGPETPFPVAQADATRLPFPDRVFGATLASHVLHLIDPWQPAVDEMVRVTRPGGVLLIDLGGPRSSGWASTGVTEQFWSQIPDGRRRRRLRGARPVDEEMRRRGFRIRSLPEVLGARETTIGELIDRLEQGTQSACWELEEGVRRQAAARTREWALRRHGSLEVRQTLERVIAWQAYDLPDS